MKSLYKIGLFPLLLAGCASGVVSVMHKAGSTQEERQAAFVKCQAQSLEGMPQIRVMQPMSGNIITMNQPCNLVGAYSYCNRFAGYSVPAQVNTYGMNLELRDQKLTRCMIDKGYSVVVRPVCTKDAAEKSVDAKGRQLSADQIQCLAQR